jgi:hypothetical protein
VAPVGFLAVIRHFMTSSITNRLQCREWVWCGVMGVTIWLMLVL